MPYTKQLIKDKQAPETSHPKN